METQWRGVILKQAERLRTELAGDPKEALCGGSAWYFRGKKDEGE